MAQRTIPLPRNLALRQVATRCRISRNGNAGLGYVMSRSTHWMREKSSQHIAVFLNGRTNNQIDVAGYGAGTLKVSVEYPTGVYTLANECIAAGNGPVSFPTGFLALTFNVDIPKNKKVRYRSHFVCASGVVWYQYQSGYICPYDEGCEIGSGSGTDKTTSGTIGAANNIIFAPVLVLAMTRQPAVALHGTSLGEGGTEMITDANLDVGLLARSIGVKFGYTTFEISASQMSGYLGGGRIYRDPMHLGTIPGVGDGVTPYFTHIVSAHGTNDIGAGATAAATAALMTAFAALYPNSDVWLTTLPPYSSSTDGWRTKANQPGWGTSGNNYREREYNDLARLGIAGAVGCFDIADAIDPFREGKWPVSRNPAATDVPTPCEFTASITGSTLTVTAIASGSLTLDAPITDSLTAGGLVAPSTTIVAQLTGSAGSTGTYQLSKSYGQSWQSANVTSRTMYVGAFGSNDGLHLTAVISTLIVQRRAINLDNIQ